MDFLIIVFYTWIKGNKNYESDLGGDKYGLLYLVINTVNNYTYTYNGIKKRSSKETYIIFVINIQF